MKAIEYINTLLLENMSQEEINNRTWYHGTSEGSANEILKNGFKISYSGFGQTGIEGIGLLDSAKEAYGYAKSFSLMPIDYPVNKMGGKPVVLEVEVNLSKTKDFSNDIKDLLDNWRPETMERLINEGYDSAIIPSTLLKSSAKELIVFDNKSIVSIKSSENTNVF